MRKVVIAIDSFKGCLSSDECGQAAEEGVKSIYPACEVIKLPIADGGEGILNALMSVTQGNYVRLYAHNPLMEVIETQYGISKDGQTAFIEMATISGLPIIPPEKRNPLITTSYGTGELIKDALNKGCRKFIIGIGGSATNDAGLGMLQALGFRFLDKSGMELETGGRIMDKVFHIDNSNIHPALKDSLFTIACDVNNPFCGPEGAAYIYARQKGADNEMIEELDKGMQSLTNVFRQITGKDITSTPGAGAAGGMGGGFIAFLNANLKSGIDLLLEAFDFKNLIKNADLIITGEGKVDRQTIMGKVPSGILREAQKQNIPVIIIAGSVEDTEELNKAGFKGVFSITPSPVSLEAAMEANFAKENIKRLIRQICRITS
ncbi:glycerate kinase [Parabacteroides bouchesdurhonensis]|uniref:glycerate kinase family protein n=1 Tax=Parabacteroides bouchesdurhonensis TaxID=1936995 RepID=UPI000E52D6BA|nr:glycerate kinase [Parabacteroides bouchesdurhonensis]RHJ90629.1 glycerate kinase [Bacteroides sp. AM07-16]